VGGGGRGEVGDEVESGGADFEGLDVEGTEEEREEDLGGGRDTNKR
jgi:hypothetical protein